MAVFTADTSTESMRKALPPGVSLPEPAYMDEQMRTDKSMVEAVTNTYEAMSWSMRDEFVQMRELGDMFIGRGWTDSETKWLESMGRVARTFNMTLPHIILTEGVAINNAYKLRCYPRNNNIVDISDVHTKVLNHQFDEAQYDRHNRRRFSDGLIFRRGWMSFSWEHTGRYPDGQMVVRRNNPFDILFDTDNGDVDINRGRQLIFTRFFTADRIRQLYAVDNREFGEYLDRKAMRQEGPMYRKRRLRSRAFLLNEMSGEMFAKDRKTGYGNDDDNTFSGSHPTTDYFDSARGLYRLIEFHERRSVDNLFIVVDPMSKAEIRVPHEYENNREYIQLQAARFGLDPTQQRSWLRWRELPEYWVTATAPGLTDEVVLMERPYSVQDPQDDLGFSIKAFSVYDEHPDKGKHLGLIDQISDPQRAFNRNMSTREDLITRMLNPDIVISDAGWAQYGSDYIGKDSRKIGAVRRYPKGQDPPKYEYPNVSIAQLLDSGSEFFMSFAERATGINANIQGRGQASGESGVLDAQRTERAETMLAPILENMRYAQAEDGRFAHAMMCKHLRYERWIRIIGADGQMDTLTVNRWNPETQQWDLKISDDFSKYDVKIDVTAATKTQQQRVFNEGMAFLGMIQDDFTRSMGMVDVLEDWDYAKKDRLQDTLRKGVLFKFGPQAFMPFEQLLKAQMMQMGIAGVVPNLLPGGTVPIPGSPLPGLPGMAGQEGGGMQGRVTPQSSPDPLEVERENLEGPMSVRTGAPQRQPGQMPGAM